MHRGAHSDMLFTCRTCWFALIKKTRLFTKRLIENDDKVDSNCPNDIKLMKTKNQNDDQKHRGEHIHTYVASQRAAFAKQTGMRPFEKLRIHTHQCALWERHLYEKQYTETKRMNGNIVRSWVAGMRKTETD